MKSAHTAPIPDSNHRTVRGIIELSVIPTVVVVLLVTTGDGPVRTSLTLYELSRGETLVSSRETIRVFLAALLWAIITGWLARFLLLMGRLMREVGRLLSSQRHSTRRFAKLRVAATLFVGAVTVPRITDNPDAVAPTATDAVSSIPIRGGLHPLPALASAGLAVGIAAHIQRERASLLRDAPVTARLRRPTRSTLSRGVALFERSKTWEHQQSPDGTFIVPLGVCDSQLVHISVCPGDVVVVDADEAEGLTVLRHLLNTIALAPWLGESRIVLHGFEHGDVVVGTNVVWAENPDDVHRLAVLQRSEFPSASVFVVSRTADIELDALVQLGVTVIAGSAETHPRRFSEFNDDVRITRIVRTKHVWRVEPQLQQFLPYGVSSAEATDLRTMVDEMTVVEIVPPRPTRKSVGTTAQDATALAVVRVLGPVEVMTSGFGELRFRKSKSTELLCWLCFHRERPTVSAARTALWEVNVADSTFHNVLSELRRGLASCGLRDVVRRDTKQLLVLDDCISTDLAVLKDVLLAADERCSDDAVRELVAMLSKVRGLPFADAAYAWADAEGITSEAVWLVTRAIEIVVDAARLNADYATVLDATAAGLRMFPGDEHFLGLRRSIGDETTAPSPNQSPFASTH